MESLSELAGKDTYAEQVSTLCRTALGVFRSLREDQMLPDGPADEPPALSEDQIEALPLRVAQVLGGGPPPPSPRQQEAAEEQGGEAGTAAMPLGEPSPRAKQASAAAPRVSLPAGQACALCLHDFETGALLREMRPCRHLYHAGRFLSFEAPE